MGLGSVTPEVKAKRAKDDLQKKLLDDLIGQAIKTKADQRDVVLKMARLDEDAKAETEALRAKEKAETGTTSTPGFTGTEFASIGGSPEDAAGKQSEKGARELLGTNVDVGTSTTTTPDAAGASSLPSPTQTSVSTTDTERAFGGRAADIIRMFNPDFAVKKGQRQSSSTSANPARARAVDDRSRSAGRIAFREANGDLPAGTAKANIESQFKDFSPMERAQGMKIAERERTERLGIEREETRNFARASVLEVLKNDGSINPEISGATLKFYRARGEEEILATTKRLGELLESGSKQKGEQAAQQALLAVRGLQLQRELIGLEKDTQALVVGTEENKRKLADMDTDGIMDDADLAGDTTEAQLTARIKALPRDNQGRMVVTVDNEAELHGVQRAQIRLGLPVLIATPQTSFGGFVQAPSKLEEFIPQDRLRLFDVIGGQIESTPEQRQGAVTELALNGIKFNAVPNGSPGPGDLATFGNIFPPPGGDFDMEFEEGHPQTFFNSKISRLYISKTIRDEANQSFTEDVWGLQDRFPKARAEQGPGSGPLSLDAPGTQARPDPIAAATGLSRAGGFLRDQVEAMLKLQKLPFKGGQFASEQVVNPAVRGSQEVLRGFRREDQ